MFIENQDIYRVISGKEIAKELKGNHIQHDVVFDNAEPLFSSSNYIESVYAMEKFVASGKYDFLKLIIDFGMKTGDYLRSRVGRCAENSNPEYLALKEWDSIDKNFGVSTVCRDISVMLSCGSGSEHWSKNSIDGTKDAIDSLFFWTKNGYRASLEVNESYTGKNGKKITRKLVIITSEDLIKQTTYKVCPTIEQIFTNYSYDEKAEVEKMRQSLMV